jgi:hypothetical protein
MGHELHLLTVLNPAAILDAVSGSRFRFGPIIIQFSLLRPVGNNPHDPVYKGNRIFNVRSAGKKVMASLRRPYSVYEDWSYPDDDDEAVWSTSQVKPGDLPA